MQKLSEQFSFFYKHYEHDYNALIADYKNPQLNVAVYGATGLIYNKLNLKNIRGSHFIRDPRDLIISAYFYHQGCNEKWCIDIIPQQGWIYQHPLFNTFLIKNPLYPEKISYQEYINSISFEEGMTLSMFRMSPFIKNMLNWNYNNPDILELRYEEIIGNEAEKFETIFNHYGFNQKVVAKGKEIAENLSLSQRKKQSDQHIRSGQTSQWKKIFTPELHRRFNLIFPEVLSGIGYEKVEWI